MQTRMPSKARHLFEPFRNGAIEYSVYRIRNASLSCQYEICRCRLHQGLQRSGESGPLLGVLQQGERAVAHQVDTRFVPRHSHHHEIGQNLVTTQGAGMFAVCEDGEPGSLRCDGAGFDERGQVIVERLDGGGAQLEWTGPYSDDRTTCLSSAPRVQRLELLR
jgi:hypothetical protein